MARAIEDLGFDSRLGRRAPPLPLAGPGAARAVGGVGAAGRARRRDLPDRARAARRLHRVPQPGPPRQAGRHDRRDQRRPLHPRPRRRLERDGVPRVRLPVRPPDRPVRGGVHDHPRPAPRRARSTSTGTYYQARDCELLPRGPRPGGPPLMIGSNGRADAADHRAARRFVERLVRRHGQHAGRRRARCASRSTPPAATSGATPRRSSGRSRSWSGCPAGPAATMGDTSETMAVRAAPGHAGGRWPRSSAPTPARASATSSSSSTRSPAGRSRNSHRSSASSTAD